jgi:hypothetical protein
MTIQRDVCGTGAVIGKLFAECLANYGDGLTPISFPLGGVSRTNDDERYSLVHFPDGMTEAVQRWMASPELRDAALIQFRAGREGHEEIRLLLLSCDGTAKLDLACAFNLARVDGTVHTSSPGCMLMTGVDPSVEEQFMDGLVSGLSEHERADELHAGFGELGPYRK